MTGAAEPAPAPGERRATATGLAAVAFVLAAGTALAGEAAPAGEPGLFERVDAWLRAAPPLIAYLTIFGLMFLESTFFPFPSEVVMIPAGYLAWQGTINLTLAIALGLVGSLGGALFNYYLAVWLGRPLLHRYGRYLFLPEEKLERVEGIFRRHGEVSTFVGRLIPAVRQVISFPAGLARMHLGRFCLFTAAGAGLWVAILAVLGFYAGENQALWKPYLAQIGWVLLSLGALVALVYLLVRRRRPAPEPGDAPPPPA